MRWSEFEELRPDLAGAGRQLFTQFGIGLAFLATVRPDGGPRLHPMCPMLVEGGLFAFISTVIRLAILCILASLVLLVGHDYVERISTRAAAEPVKAGLVGVLAQLLFLPLLIVTIVVLVVTIIGIPFLALVPFVVLGLVVLLIVGFTAVAYQVGRLVSARLGSATLNPYLTVIVGILAISRRRSRLACCSAAFSGSAVPCCFRSRFPYC